VNRLTSFLVKLAALGLVFLVIGIRPITAQDVDRLGKLDANSRFQYDLIIDSAKVLGLPTASLRLKALEGLAKGADSREIVKQVRLAFVRLRDARAALGNVSDGELQAGADLLKVVGPDQLSAFKNPPRNRSPLAAFVVLGDLVTRGVPRDEASSAIVRMWQGGAADADFVGLFKGVEGDILQGLSPGTALQIRMKEMPGRTKITPPTGQPEPQSSK
jgi:hypothetical protein